MQQGGALFDCLIVLRGQHCTGDGKCSTGDYEWSRVWLKAKAAVFECAMDVGCDGRFGLGGERGIAVGDEFLGVAGGCGHLLEGGEIESFMINKTIDMDESQIEAMAKEIVTMSQEEAESLVEFIRREVEKIVSDYDKKN